MLWAVTGHTAAEIVQLRSNPLAPNMGLTAWSGSVVRRQDAVVAKNYLATDEIKELDQIVTMYLDYAEDQAQRRRTMTMNDWVERLDVFLQFNERDVLTHPGTVQAKVARALAEERYDAFNRERMQQEALEAEAADLEALRALEEKYKGYE